MTFHFNCDKLTSNFLALYETLKTENREHESDKIIMKNEYIKECTRLKEQQSDVLAKLENTYQKNISDLEKKGINYCLRTFHTYIKHI